MTTRVMIKKISRKFITIEVLDYNKNFQVGTRLKLPKAMFICNSSVDDIYALKFSLEV